MPGYFEMLLLSGKNQQSLNVYEAMYLNLYKSIKRINA